MNCCCWPATIEALAGVTAMDTNTGAVTVRLVEPLMGPEAALIVVLPAATAVASPPAPMVATEVALEVQAAVLVRF